MEKAEFRYIDGNRNMQFMKEENLSMLYRRLITCFFIYHRKSYFTASDKWEAHLKAICLGDILKNG